MSLLLHGEAGQGRHPSLLHSLSSPISHYLASFWRLRWLAWAMTRNVKKFIKPLKKRIVLHWVLSSHWKCFALRSRRSVLHPSLCRLKIHHHPYYNESYSLLVLLHDTKTWPNWDSQLSLTLSYNYRATSISMVLKESQEETSDIESTKVEATFSHPVGVENFLAVFI